MSEAMSLTCYVAYVQKFQKKFKNTPLVAQNKERNFISG